MSQDTVMYWKLRLFMFHRIYMYYCGSILFHLLHIMCAVNMVTTIQHVHLPLDISDYPSFKSAKDASNLSVVSCGIRLAYRQVFLSS